ncbi:MAG: hypothetical protein GF353_19925 [Candidatus Lokiarchaeota archaeon]|nr:hypothetical protein [Candidatus Lokiarchaeota archaeon]
MTKNHYINFKMNRCSFSFFLLIILASIFLRLIFLEAPLQSDDTSYFSLAKSYSSSMLKSAHSQISYRTGLFAPILFFQKVIGFNIFSYYASSLFCYLLLIFSIYFVAYKTRGIFVATFSVTIASSSSLILKTTSNLLPDALCFSFCLLAFTFFYLARRKSKHFIGLFIVLSAFLGFYGYMVRFTGLIFLVCIPIYEIIRYRSLKHTIIFLFFFLIFLIIEIIYFWIMVGDPFSRFKIIFYATSGWSKYMHPISFKQYVFHPLRILLGSFSGKFFSILGFIGFAISIKKKDWWLFSILCGAIILFMLYSYSVTSISPLIRTLPLHSRYILPFTVSLALSSAYFIYIIYNWIANRLKTKCAYLAIGMLLALVTLFQVRELPKRIPGAILFGNDSYFITNRLLQYRLLNLDINQNEPVYAFPLKDFILYKNFRKLNLKNYNPSKINLCSDDVVLFSKFRVRRSLYYAEIRNDIKTINSLKHLAIDNNPGLDYIIDGGDIILARVEGF